MAKEWERWQSTILDLYKVQKKTLAEVMRIMDKEHGFKASTRAFRSRLKRWEVDKYVTPSRRWMRAQEPLEFSQNIPIPSHPALPLTTEINFQYPLTLSSECEVQALPNTDSNITGFTHLLDFEYVGGDLNARAESNFQPPEIDPVVDLIEPASWLREEGLLEDWSEAASYEPFSLGFGDRQPCPTLPDEVSTFKLEGSGDSGISVTDTQHWHVPAAGVPVHLDPAYREKRGRDDDFDRLVTAFNFRDQQEQEIERIFEARPDLLALKQADSESDDDPDESLPHKAIDRSESLRPIITDNTKPEFSDDKDNEFLPESSAKAQSRLQGKSRELPTIQNCSDHNLPAERRAHIYPAALREFDLKDLSRSTTGGIFESNLEKPYRLSDDARMDLDHASSSRGKQCSANIQGLLASDGSWPPSVNTRFSDTATLRKNQDPDDQETARSFRMGPLSDNTDSLDSDDSVLHSEFAWLEDLFDPRPALDASHPFLSVESATVEKVIDSYQSNTTNDQEGHGTQTCCSGSSGSTVSPGDSQGKNPMKRVRDEAEPPINEEQNGPLSKTRRKQVSEGEPRLACPFQKRYPERYPACAGFLTIAHVKQHLRRCHRRIFCPRCKTSFATEEQKDAHFMAAISVPCAERADALPDGLSQIMIDALARRIRGANLPDQWFNLWDLIFPGITRPATCIYDLCAELVLGLCSYLEAEGPGIVQSVLRENDLGVWSEAEDIANWPTDIGAFTRDVLSQAFRQIVQGWRARMTPQTP